MRLDEYIYEAISSGRTLSRKAESAPRSQKLEDVKVWLEGIGVPFSEDYGRFNISNAYLTNDGKNFAVLFPENVTGKEVLFVAKITSSGYVKPLRMSVGGKVVDAFEPNNRLDVDKFFDKISETATGVTEAVSSGRWKNGYAPSKGCTIYDLKNWLDSKGVEGHDWVIDYQMSPEKPGQIIYLIGPCDTPGHTWISVSNHVKKNGSWVMQRIVIPVKIDRFHTPFITSGYGEEFPLSFDSAIEGIEYMIEHPTSYLVKKNDSVISEAISSGKSKYVPEPGCSIEEMTTWLDSIGISGRIVNATYKESFDIPKDKPTYVVVTGHTFPWLAVQNKFGQRVAVSLAPSDTKPWADIYYSKSRPTAQLGFREGIECIERMAKYPEKRVQSGFISSLFDEFSGESYTIEAVSSSIVSDADIIDESNAVRWLDSSRP